MELISPVSQNQRGVLGKMVPFSFPASKCALWNPAPVGESIVSHLCYRNPKLIMHEKTLRLTHRHARQSRRKPFTCFLLGNLAIDEDGEGVSLTIDRFDPGREVTGGLGKIPTASLPGDFLIPCTVSAWGFSSGDVIVHNSEDFSLAFKILQQNLNSQDSLEPSKLLTLRVHIYSTEDMDNLNFDFHWAAVTFANALKYTPVNSVPIIPTALARNLSSHMSITQLQGTCKCGYLTMDQTRKLLLVLESDPKAYTLPLIGIWLSGISHINSPQVWTCSLHYLFNSSIQERVLSESGSFLVILYSLTHKDPEFYECLPCGGHTKLGFQLLTSKETLRCFKNVEPSDKYHIQFELSSENKNAEVEFFSKISKNVSFSSPSQGSSASKLSVSDHDSGVEEDASPRPFPRPHPVSQQMTEIQPSVPELSIVFDGISTESMSTSKNVMVMDKKPQPSLGHQPAKMACSIGHPPHQLQSCDSGKQSLGFCAREPSPRQLPNQIKQRNSVLKSSSGKKPPLQQQSNCGIVGSQARKSSGSSSSSSPSTPCSGFSPNTSSHQLGTPEQHLANNEPTQSKGELPFNGPSGSNSKQSHLVSQPSWHSCALSSPHMRRPMELRIPSQSSPCCPHCVCSCQLRDHMQYSPTNVWQGMSTVGSGHTPEIQSSSSQESTQLMFHQNTEYIDACCNPVCPTSSPMNLGHHGIVGKFCPHNDDMSATVKSSSSDPGSAQSHAVYPACVHTHASKLGPNNGIMNLPSDVYKILAEQDKQIKLLQAQIQRLLEAQTLQPCSTKTIANSSIQSEKQLEFVAMETQSSTGLHMKKSVSIAVSTGASLMWNATLENKNEHVKQDDVEISSEDINISMNTEKNRSQASIASSLNAVDIPSFVDSIHLVEGASQPSGLRSGPDADSGLPPISSMNESVSMCMQTSPSERADSHLVAVNEQNIEHVITYLPNAPPDDQKFYQDILGQVNHFLKESSEENSSSVQKDITSSECTTASKMNKTERRGSVNPDPLLSDKDIVLNATLKQLRNLGVKFDSPDKMMNSAHKVENASILACINPEAVVPGLNYISFANVGMSGLTPNGVDLSMEANAIALKYLSESQLSQLSLSHSSQKNSMASSVQTLLHTNTDKTLVGFGLISPSNMSFATKKYMKRYGLLQSSDGSDDEEKEQTDYSRGKNIKPVLQLNLNPLLDGFSCQKDPYERGSERLSVNPAYHESELSSTHLSNPEGPILRNVTNAVIPLRILHQSDESSYPFFKDMNPQMKLLPGKAEFTQHPDKENLDNQIVSETHQAPIVDNLKQVDNMNSVGTFLDVQKLRQLPKLF
ncbi:SCL-interrupting locus protein isoform X1 [Podarcis raffonei]|uniref:SCL-interrupting locus protein isoform X1 n=1 Tax=Podarcis raffonei TaxID=65483 RepID=UPI0023291E78|nr:SCL-interrupting locus protein isoform X1 [Podarcis raffonei]XP_053248481.1 SCL-interrupting locus protein isoform X1 [Podarcis raffonei]